MGIQAILFDCDGVLVDSEHLMTKSDVNYFIELGVEFTVEQHLDLFLGQTYAKNLEVLRDTIYPHANDTTLTEDGFINELSRRRTQVLRDELEAIEGAIKFVKMLEARGVKKATCSNTMKSEWLHTKMEKAGLLSYFAPHVICSNDVAKAKPEPDMYLKGAADLDVAPENCLVIEDSATGARAGLAAGMHTVGFTGAAHLPEGYDQRLYDAGVDHVCANYEEFTAYIEPLLHADLKKAV